MRAHAPVTIKCLLKELRELLPPLHFLPFSETQPFLQRKAKARKLGSNFLGQRAAGRNKRKSGVCGPGHHAHWRGAASATGKEQREKAPATHITDSCGRGSPTSLLDPWASPLTDHLSPGAGLPCPVCLTCSLGCFGILVARVFLCCLMAGRQPLFPGSIHTHSRPHFSGFLRSSNL